MRVEEKIMNAHNDQHIDTPCSHCGRSSSSPTPNASRVVVRWRSMYAKHLCGSCYFSAPVVGLSLVNWRRALDDVCRDSRCGHGGEARRG